MFTTTARPCSAAVRRRGAKPARRPCMTPLTLMSISRSYAAVSPSSKRREQDPRVVDQRVQAPGPGHQVGQDPLEGPRRRGRRGGRADLAGQRRGLVDEVREARLVHVVRTDGPALRRERQRRRAPDPCRAAGDGHHPVLHGRHSYQPVTRCPPGGTEVTAAPGRGPGLRPRAGAGRRARGPRAAAGRLRGTCGSARAARGRRGCPTARRGRPRERVRPRPPRVPERDPDRRPRRGVVPRAATGLDHPAPQLEGGPRPVRVDRRGRHRPDPQVERREVGGQVGQHRGGPPARWPRSRADASHRGTLRRATDAAQTDPQVRPTSASGRPQPAPRTVVP